MATKRGDGRWQAKKTVSGTILYGYGKTKKDAEDDLAEKVRAAQQTLTGDMKLYELRERWKAVFWEARAVKTREADETAWNKVRDLHSLSIKTLRRSYLSDVLNGIYSEHSRTAEQVRTHLRQLFAYALDREWVEANPVEGIVWRTKRKSVKHRKLTRLEVERILGAESPLHLFWRFLAETGLRPWSEALKMDAQNWRRVEDQWFVQVPESKTDAGVRVVPVAADMAEALAGHSPTFRWRGKRLTKTVASDQWRELLKDLEIPHTRPYELRHYANVQFQLSDSPELLKRWMMGHAGGELGLTVYGKSSPENMMEIMQKVSPRVSKE